MNKQTNKNKKEINKKRKKEKVVQQQI